MKVTKPLTVSLQFFEKSINNSFKIGPYLPKRSTDIYNWWLKWKLLKIEFIFWGHFWWNDSFLCVSLTNIVTVLPLQIFLAIWTWSLATLLAKGEVFSQDIASKPGLNEFLHQNLGFEWGSAGYYHYKYFWLFELEVKPLFWPKVKIFLKLLPPNQASMNFYIQILDLSEVLQGITIENISRY